MKPLPLQGAFCAICLTSLSPLGAQEAPDIEARRQSVVALEQNIADREERLGELKEDISRLDKRVERYIDKLVARLESIGDSKDSQVRVAQMKERAIDGLSRTIEYYVQKRNGIEASLSRKDPVVRGQLEADLKKFDARIEKRVAQIIELTKSFAGHEEIAKYHVWTEETRGRGRRDDTKYRLSDDWLHNRKNFRHTEAQLKEVSEALRGNIERLEREVSALEGKLEPADLASGLRQIYEEELEHSKAMIKLREAQLEDLSKSTGVEQTRPADRDEILTIEQGLDEASADLREDFFAIFTKYAEASAEREQIAKLKANLAARKAWLEEHGGQ